MLTLIFGRAGTGKTAYVMEEIRRRAASGETGLYLLVPEQYSHDAERRLCNICGDTLSLHGEALSFSRLCSRVFAETGGLADKALDAGALMLVMCRALEAVSPDLRVFRGRGMRADFLERLLVTGREMKSLGISPDKLAEFSALTTGPLADKLSDLSLILTAYDGFFGEGALDPSDRITRMAERLHESTFGDSGHIWFDGFNDFTAQESAVILELFKKRADMTFCLTCDGLSGGGDIFELPQRTARQLMRLADEYGLETEVVHMEGDGDRRSPALWELERRLFTHDVPRYDGDASAIAIYRARDVLHECELAAAEALRLAREGYRWRDISIVTPDWEGYGAVCGGVLEKYGVPFFSGGREDILQKPPIALVDAALETIASGWDYTAVFRYLKTGLAGLSPPECAELENYVIKWGIRGSMWTRRADWTLPISGYGGRKNGADDIALSRINSLRRRAAAPLISLERAMRLPAASDKLRALYAFLEDIELPRQIEEKAGRLDAYGHARLAKEYGQLWDVLINAMEQFYDIAGGISMDAAEFRRLMGLLLSRYDVGVIPVSLDRVSLGEMSMSRRRDIRCLIVIGATDAMLPKVQTGGILSDSEREELIRLGAHEAGGPDFKLFREMNMIYSSLTLPKDRLVISYPTGGGARPSTIVRRIRAIFGIEPKTPGERHVFSLAPEPCFELMARSGALAEFINLTEFERRARAALRARNRKRERLAPTVAGKLYGDAPRLTASRADKYSSCKFAFFLQNGLRAREREPAIFDARDAGTFTHFILENVTRDLFGGGMPDAVTEQLCRELTARCAAELRADMFRGEPVAGRLDYLLSRLEKDAAGIALDTALELQSSDFRPYEFESQFSDVSPDGHLIRGLIDRIDGWERDGKLYLRVVDYKTGSKSFSLSDIMHGTSMQMLIYLFALERSGLARYGRETVSAGVLYAPARDVIVKAPRGAPDSEIVRLREKELRRTGIVLADGGVIEAMERGAEKKYLPVKISKTGEYTGGVATPRQMKLLEGHVDSTLRRIADGIRAGEIDRDPYYKSPVDNACLYCEYAAACQFSEEAGDRRRYLKTIKPEEIWATLEEGDK